MTALGNVRRMAWLALALTSGLQASSTLGEPLELRPGLWELELERVIGDHRVGAEDVKECITSEDLRELGDLRRFVVAMSLTGAHEECTLADFEVAGNSATSKSVTFTASCDDGDEHSSARVAATVASDSYTIVADIETDEGVAIRIERSGRRLGSCP